MENRGKAGKKYRKSVRGGSAAGGWSLSYWAGYTGLFLVLCLLTFFPFLAMKKGFVWTGADWAGDGGTQYFPYLHYIGNWLREAAAGLLDGSGVRTYDFCIGMGSDIRTVVRLHLLDLAAAVVPQQYTELLYGVLALLRMYLAGLNFSAFCFYWKKPRQAVLAGSMIYVFCGYVLKLGVEHPFFTIPMILLPLLLIGAEQVLRREGMLLFAFITMLGFVTHYYFMYMCSFAMAGYVALRFFDLYREQRFKHFFRVAARLFAGYFLGIGMSMAALAPTVLQLLSTARLDAGGSGEALWIYENTGRYLNWFFDLISPYRGTGSNTNLNYIVLVLPALILLFVRRIRERLALKAAVLTEILVLLIPAGGYVLGGFSNVNNRWVFILSFTVSLVCVLCWEEFGAWSRAQALAFGVVLCGFGVLFGYRLLAGKKDVYQLAAFAELGICGVLFLALQKRRMGRRGRTGALLAVICISAAVNGYLTYAPAFGNLTGEFLTAGKAQAFYDEAPTAELARLSETDFYRTDTDALWIGEENIPIMLRYPGISLYNSYISAEETQYFLDTENPGLNSQLRVLSLDGRTAPEALANVRYYLTENGEESVPWGFERIETSGQDQETAGTAVYENKYPLSFGYTYDAVISQEAYEQLSTLEKQQIMLEAAVIESAGLEGELPVLRGLEQGEIQTETVSLPESGENVQRIEEGYRVGKGGGSITVPVRPRANCECYLYLKGLEWEGNYSTVRIEASGLSKKLSLRAEGENYSLGRKDFLVNLGSRLVSGEETVTICFPKKGTYRLRELEVSYVSMENYSAEIAERNEEALTEISSGKDWISGEINLTKQKFIVFSIPYDKGWSVYVDGERAALQKANVMYLGLFLEPGAHKIELRYETPGFKAGAVVSLGSWIVFLLIFVYGKRRKGAAGRMCA